jgi:F-type H+-transporting ATPase subunit gamma
MSGTLASLQRKISSAGDLNGVVRAMKALAASSIGQYEKAVQSLDDYDRTVQLGLSLCLRHTGFARINEFRAAGPVGAIVFGSDQGLVGHFNEAVVDFAVGALQKLPNHTKKIWAVGDRVHGLLSDTGMAPVRPLSVPTSVNGISAIVGQILIEVEAARERGEVVEVYVFHNHPKPGALYEPVSKKLLPLNPAWQEQFTAIPWPTKALPEVIEGPTLALEGFLRGYFFVLLFQACAESLNSENASRLAAMQRAEKNIKDILENLNREFHRLRQESIDEELFDVVSGFEALTKGKNED